MSQTKMIQRPIKLVLAGESGVGKTSYLEKLTNNVFLEKHNPTLGVDVQNLCFNLREKTYVFSVWDVAGKEEHRGLGDAYFIGADCAIVMTDLTFSDPLDSEFVWNWVKRIRRIDPDMSIMIVCNKCDKVKKNKFCFEKMNDVQIYNISTKTGFDCEKPFDHIVRTLQNKSKIY